MIVWEVINAKIVLWLDGKERRAHDDAKELKLWKEEQVQESPSAPQRRKRNASKEVSPSPQKRPRRSAKDK